MTSLSIVAQRFGIGVGRWLDKYRIRGGPYTPTALGNGQSEEAGKQHITSGRSGGSKPLPRTEFYHEHIGLPECPYMTRWVADFGLFALRLHRWRSSDDDRAFHDHSWWFCTIVLWGAYTDVSEHGRDRLRTGSIRYRPALHRHTVEIEHPDTWTLLVTGKPFRRWGFWVNGKLIKRDKYFATRGHHPCMGKHEPVRRRPDGSRI